MKLIGMLDSPYVRRAAISLSFGRRTGREPWLRVGWLLMDCVYGSRSY